MGKSPACAGYGERSGGRLTHRSYTTPGDVTLLNDIDRLLPWAWKAERAAKAAPPPEPTQRTIPLNILPG